MPTLVLHARRDRMNDFALGRELAARIPGARLVALDSDNHIMLADEPAWPVFVDEVTAFLAPDRVAAGTPAGALRSLTEREIDVLRLVGQGRDNDGGRAGARAQRPHRRTPPDQHLRQARPQRAGRPGRGGRPPPRGKLTPAAEDDRSGRHPVRCPSNHRVTLAAITPP